MELSKGEVNNFNKIDNLMNDLNNCGDKYCGNIIKYSQIKEEEPKFFQFVTKKCRSKKIPKTEKENKLKQQKYNTCFTKYKNRSKYYKNLTRRKKCEDKKCHIYQNKIKKLLTKKK
jgi:hypothetical protein